jgi:hypothetical protein
MTGETAPHRLPWLARWWPWSRARDDPGSDPLGLLALRLRGDLPLREAGGRSLLVVGADHEEAARQTALGLAWCFADELGHSVLLIDGAFGGDALGAALGAPGQPGLVEWLQAGTTDTQIATGLDTWVQATAHSRVKVLTRGAPDRPITVPEGAMRDLLRQACAAHDMVLVLGSVRDDVHRSLACAAVVDAALVVAVEELSTMDAVSRAQRLLDECGAPRVALVLARRPVSMQAAGR